MHKSIRHMVCQCLFGARRPLAHSALPACDQTYNAISGERPKKLLNCSSIVAVTSVGCLPHLKSLEKAFRLVISSASHTVAMFQLINLGNEPRIHNA